MFWILLFWNLKLTAEIRLDRGELILPAIDLSLKDYQFERVYYSRSTHLGLFGMSWCTVFDVSFLSFKENKLTIDFCGNEVNFIKTKANAFLEERRLGNAIFNSDGSIIVYWKDSRIYFDANRKLKEIHLYSPTNHQNLIFSSIQRTKENFNFMVNNEFRVNMLLNANGLAEEITSNNLKARYQYSDLYLKEVINAWGNKYEYHYNKENLLSSIQYPDNKEEQFYYYPNSQRWIKEFKRKDQCRETYSYHLESVDKNAHTAKVNIQCPQKKTFEISHHFAGTTTKNVISQRDYIKTEFSIMSFRKENPVFDKNGRLISFNYLGLMPVKLKYDSQGKIESWNDDQSLLKIHYDKKGQVQAISADDLGKIELRKGTSKTMLSPITKSISQSNSDQLWQRYNSIIATTEKILKKGGITQ